MEFIPVFLEMHQKVKVNMLGPTDIKEAISTTYTLQDPQLGNGFLLLGCITKPTFCRRLPKQFCSNALKVRVCITLGYGQTDLERFQKEKRELLFVGTCNNTTVAKSLQL